MKYEDFAAYFDQGAAAWADGLLRGIAIADPTDSMERAEAERPLWDRFAELADAVKRARAEAEAAIKALPVPSAAIAAGVRQEPYFWSTASCEARDAFPELFATFKP